MTVYSDKAILELIKIATFVANNPVENLKEESYNLSGSQEPMDSPYFQSYELPCSHSESDARALAHLCNIY